MGTFINYRMLPAAADAAGVSDIMAEESE